MLKNYIILLLLEDLFETFTYCMLNGYFQSVHTVCLFDVSDVTYFGITSISSIIYIYINKT